MTNIPKLIPKKCDICDKDVNYVNSYVHKKKSEKFGAKPQDKNLLESALTNAGLKIKNNGEIRYYPNDGAYFIRFCQEHLAIFKQANLTKNKPQIYLDAFLSHFK